MARRRKAQMELPVAAEEAGAVAQVASDAVTESPRMDPPKKWRVARTTKVSLFGQLTTLQEGDVVTVAGYGALGVKRIAEQVELVPVE